MATVIGSATIKILPDSSGFTAALNGQLRGVGQSVNRSMGGANNALSGTQRNLRGLTDSLGRFGSRMILTGEAMTFGITRPLIQMGSAIVGTAAKFDEAKRTIAAVAEIDILGSNAAEGMAELDAIGEIAIELGRKGKFSALEMAEGFVEIARAGIETKEGLEAVGEVVRKIATVENIEMGKSAELLINVFAGLGGEFEDTGDSIFRMADGTRRQKDEFGGLAGELEALGDVLALVSAKTTTDIVDLGNAFRYAGPVARSAGVDVEEAAAALGVLAQSGFNATVGGTALRNIITRLAIPTLQSQEIFEKFGLSVEQAFSPENNAPLMESEIADLIPTLSKAGLSAEEIDEALRGIATGGAAQTMDEVRAAASDMKLEIFDANGEMIPLVEIFDQFDESGARIGDIMKLFGQRAGPAFLALMSNRDAMAALHAETLDAGGALDNMSKTIEGSATIQFARLKNALVELAIRIGESGMLDFFTDLSLRLTHFVQVIADSQPQLFKYALALGAIIAAMGPMRIAIGLGATALKSFLQLVTLAGTPLGPIVIAIGAVVAAFALMINQSDTLRAAMGALFESVKLVALPILEELARVAGGVITLIGNLAGHLGDMLAPAIADAAESINEWVTSGGLLDFLQQAVRWISDLAIEVVLLWEEFKRSDAMDAIQTGFERIIALAVDFWDTIQPIIHNLIPALLDVGDAVGTTLAVAFKIAWEAADVLLGVLEGFIDVLGPIARFVGQHLAPILGLLAVRLFYTRSASIAAATGLTRFVTAVGVAGTSAGTSLNRIAGSVDGFALRASSAIQRAANAFSTLNVSAGVALTALGQKVLTAGSFVGTAMRRMATAAQNMGRTLNRAAGVAQAAMGGFFTGVIIAQAQTATDKMIGFGTAAANAAQSAAAGFALGGPAGAAIMGGVSILSTGFGIMAGNAKEADEAVFDLTQTTEQLVEEMKNLGAELSANVLLSGLEEALTSEYDTTAYADFAEDLEQIGLNAEDLGDALRGGGDSVEDFIDRANMSAFEAAMDRVTIKAGTLNEELGIKPGDILTDPSQIEATITALDNWGGRIEVINERTGESFEIYGSEVGSAAEGINIFMDGVAGITDLDLGSQFRDHGAAVVAFGHAIDDARINYEAIKDIIALTEREEADLEIRTMGWVDQIRNARDALDEARQQIRDLFEPPEDPRLATAEFFSQLREDLGSLSIEITDAEGNVIGRQLLDVDMADPFTEEGQRLIQSMQDLRTEAADLWAEVVIDPEVVDITTFDAKWEEMREIYMGGLTRMDGDFRLSTEQANALLDDLFVRPPDEQILVQLGLDTSNFDPDSPKFQAILADVQNKVTAFVPELGQFEPEIIATFEARTQGTMTLEQMVSMAESLKGQENLFTTLDLLQGDLPAPWTFDMINALLTFGVLDIGNLEAAITATPQIGMNSSLTPEQNATIIAALTNQGVEAGAINTFLNVIPSGDAFTALGLDPATLTTLIAGGTVATQGNLQTFLEVIPELGDVAGIDAGDEQSLAAKMIRGGASTAEVNASFDILVENPDLFAKVNDLLAGGDISPVNIPVTIELLNDPSTGAMFGGMSNEEIGNLIRFAAGWDMGFAEGGIVTKDIIARLGEDGPEAVVPLTKPGRAAAVMADAGLFRFAFETVMAGGSAGPISIESLSDSFSGFGFSMDDLPTGVGGAGGGQLLPIEFPGMDVADGVPVTDVEIRVILIMVGAGEILAQMTAITSTAVMMAGTVSSAFTVANAAIINSFMGVISVMLQIIAIQPAIFAMLTAMSAAFAGTASIIIRAISAIVIALSQIPVVMAQVSLAISRGFSRPFSLIASQVWNPFASFINSAATAVGLGAILPTGLSIPVFHEGGIVGDGTGDSFDPTKRGMNTDETLALLRNGEGVMTEQMMANMTDSQLRAFKSGEKRWWAVGGPFEDGQAQATSRITSGSDPWADLLDYDSLVADYNANISPLIDQVVAAYPNNMIAAIASESMHKVGDATLDYARGYSEEMNRSRISSVGLPPGFDLTGTVPAGFDIAGWRSFLGANKKGGSYPLLMAYLNAAGVPYLVNSTFRPGDSGSYHSLARAVDFGAPNDANYDSPGLLRIDRAFAPMLGVLSELIYSGPGGISDKAYDGATMAAHHNHVHAALRDGGIVQDLVYAMLGENGPEVVLPMDNPMRALSLARRSGILRTLQQAQNQGGDYRAPGAASNRNTAIDAGDGGPLTGAGNTYHIHGQSASELDAKIRNRDRAAMRKRR